MSVLQEFYESLGGKVMHDKEQILLEHLENVGGWCLVSDLAGRLVCNHLPNGDEVYCLDGKPFITFKPLQTKWVGDAINGYKITVQQQYFKPPPA